MCGTRVHPLITPHRRITVVLRTVIAPHKGELAHAQPVDFEKKNLIICVILLLFVR